MIDRAPASFTVSGIRIGRTDLGAGTATIDDDAMLLELRAATDARPVRVPLDTVDGVVLEDATVTLALHDGGRLSLACAAAPDLRDATLVRCQAVPELTRALRAFGSRRGHRHRDSAPAEQQRFFAPLLAARRTAVTASAPSDALAAFDAARLADATTRVLHAFAADRHGDSGPSRRALEAELVDAAEPLGDALDTLGLVAADAAADVDDLHRWRAWARQLKATFEVADRVWLALDRTLDSASDTLPARP